MVDYDSGNNLKRTIEKLGYKAEFVADIGMIQITEFNDCKCCAGFVNNCDGNFCSNLGMCICLYTNMQDREYTKEMKRREN